MRKNHFNFFLKTREQFLSLVCPLWSRSRAFGGDTSNTPRLVHLFCFKQCFISVEVCQNTLHMKSRPWSLPSIFCLMHLLTVRQRVISQHSALCEMLYLFKCPGLTSSPFPNAVLDHRVEAAPMMTFFIPKHARSAWKTQTRKGCFWSAQPPNNSFSPY